MGHYKQLDIDRQNWAAIQREVDSIDEFMSPGRKKMDCLINRVEDGRVIEALPASQCEINGILKRQGLFDPRKKVKQVSIDVGTCNVTEIHQQLIPRFIVLLSMAMSIVLGIAVLMLASLLLLATA